MILLTLLLAAAPGCSRSLAPGAFLAVGESLTSCRGKAKLVHQLDGNVVVYDTANQRALWATGTDGKSTNSFVMQDDGNLVLYAGAGDALWAAGTNGSTGATVVMQDDGNLVIYSPESEPLWSTNTKVAAPPPPFPPAPAPCGGLQPGDSLSRGQSVSSCSGQFMLIHQLDGNLVLYDEKGSPLWATQTHGKASTSVEMQSDGNLVLYDGSTPLWSSGTHGNAGATLWLQDDGNAVVYADPRPLWASGTNR